MTGGVGWREVWRGTGSTWPELFQTIVNHILRPFLAEAIRPCMGRDAMPHSLFRQGWIAKYPILVYCVCQNLAVPPQGLRHGVLGWCRKARTSSCRARA